MRIILLLLPMIILIPYSTIMTILFFSVRQRMRGLSEPELWLPKAEREEHARKLLRREDEQYEQQRMEELQKIIQDTALPPMTASNPNPAYGDSDTRIIHGDSLRYRPSKQ